MKIQKVSMAGTLESSDVQVIVEPHTDGIDLIIESDVINQYGRKIKQVSLDVLGNLGIDNVKIRIIDKGALECTLKARIEAAVYRSNESSEKNVPWGGLAQ